MEDQKVAAREVDYADASHSMVRAEDYKAWTGQHRTDVPTLKGTFVAAEVANTSKRPHEYLADIREFHSAVGTMPPERVTKYLEGIKNEIKQSRMVAEVDEKPYDPTCMTEDFIFPARGTDRGSKVEKLPAFPEECHIPTEVFHGGEVTIAGGDSTGVGEAGSILISTGGDGIVRWTIPTISLDELSEDKIEAMVNERIDRLIDKYDEYMAGLDSQETCKDDPEALIFKGDSEKAMFPLGYVEHLENEVLELTNAHEDELDARIALEEILGDVQDALGVPCGVDIVQYAVNEMSRLDNQATTILTLMRALEEVNIDPMKVLGVEFPEQEEDPAEAYARAMKIVGR